MAIRYHYDLYPRTDPRDGARTRRFTKLQRAIYHDVIGVGQAAADIRSTDPEAADLDPRGEQYVRVVREDTVAETELVVGGWWVNRYNHDTAVARQTKRLTFAGAGTMAYLARARMWSHTYMWELDNDFVPQDPFDDIWRLWAQGNWAGGDYLGAVLWRVIQEALHYRTGSTYTHRHADGETYTDAHDDDRTATQGSSIEFVTLGFDQYEDSDGTPWTWPSGEFQASVGENVLSVVQRIMQAGLYVEMDPDTFELRAWQGRPASKGGRSTNRTGGAWGTGVVRFQAPTDGTVATGNMLSNSEREINSHLPRHIILAGGQDTYARAIAAIGNGIRWEGFESSTASDVDALEQIAATQIQAREEAADAGSIRMKLGTSQVSGKYRPWEEVRLDDLVTVHTGTGEWDYDEATYPIAGLKIELKKSGAWWAWAELGASFGGGSERRFQTAPTAAHSHPPNPRLCVPTTIDTFRAVETLGATCTLDPVNYTSLGGLGPSQVERVQLTLTRAAIPGQTVVVITSQRGSGASTYALVDSQGNIYTEAAHHGDGNAEPRIWYSNVTTALTAGDILTYEVGGAGTGSLERGGKCITAYVFDGTLSSPAESGTGASFGGSPSVAVGGAELIVAAIAWKGGSSGFPDTFTPDADWTAFTEAATNANAADAQQIEGGFRIGDAGGETYSGTIDQSRDWVTVGATFATSASGGAVNDGHRDLVGTSVRAARCDHRHDVHRDTAPTVDDDWATAGYKLGTIWAQLDDLNNPTAIVGVWMLVDTTTGAAVWAEFGGGSHAASHEEGGADELEIEDLATAETDTALVLHPDGAGGVEWGTDATGGGGGSDSNLWTMSKTASQTLTSNADTVITFDRNDIDAGGGVIDLANDRFVVPATGRYLVNANWHWESTVPNGAGRMSITVNGTIVPALIRLDGGTQGASGGLTGTVPLSLTAGDLIQLIIHPGAAVTPTARGNASRTLSTSLTLVQVKSGGAVGSVTYFRKTAGQSFSSTSYADSTGMAFAVDASKVYKFRMVIFYNTNATSVGIKLAIQGPASATAYVGMLAPSTAGSLTATATMHSTVAFSADISTDLAVLTPATGPGGATAMAILEGMILTGANAGTVKLRHASETATATTVVENSHGEVVEIA